MLAILLVDDEPTIRLPVSDALRSRGHRVTTANDGGEAMARLDGEVFDVVVSDVRLPKADGFAILRRVRAESPDTDVLLMTAYGTIEDAVSAMKEKAIEYVTKPFDIEELVQLVERIDERRRLRRELDQARAQLAVMGPDTVLIGRSPAMLRVKERIDAIASSDAAVLVTGESGTGKELVARLLHDRSPRRERPFVALNCSAIPHALLEAELFGYDRGAFTGAHRRREGKLQAVDGGTLFLDEIGEMPLEAQVKLLRFLQAGEFEPLGMNTRVKVDVRVVSATNRDLKAWVAEGKFREDLYYRIKVFETRIPPLRERATDLPLLVAHFLRRFTPSPGPPKVIAPAAWAALTQYPFPGNVRELEHAIEHAAVLSRGQEIDIEHLPPELHEHATVHVAQLAHLSRLPHLANGAHAIDAARPLHLAMEQFERQYILRALEATHGERKRTADVLGISRKCLWQKLRKYGEAAAADSEMESDGPPATPATTTTTTTGALE